ncbi:MAG: O-phosphoserine--tRNA ligase [Candidatus Aenigmarchaeota archaeon]|nr:O-phosphoserine--tRNA ligase [Candidatus Aenigmarchaeota archaeon]
MAENAVDFEDIKRRAKADFEKTWKETASPLLGKGDFRYPSRKGKEHLLMKYVFNIRKALLDLGFDEVITPIIQPPEEIVKQYGPESPAILDRIYYLATLPRPDIGLPKKKKELIVGKIPGFDKFDKLQEILMKYKRSEIEGGEDFTEALVKDLGLTTPQAHFMIDEAFPELKNIRPEPLNLSLISHATTAWFPTLSRMLDTSEMPVMLFSVVWRFRREQKEDNRHLRAHLNLSMVVMDPNFKIENGKELTEKFFRNLGFTEVKFEPKPNQPAYYAPGTNYEVFIKHPKIGWIEVTEIGMYSPVALANYKIPYPVFNSGPGLGRIVMAIEKIDDIRALYYPHTFGGELTDKDIAEGLELDRVPMTKEGKTLAKIIEDGIRKHADDLGIVQNEIFSGEIGGKAVKVFVSEPEEGKKLLGPGGHNVLYVHDGNIMAVKPGHPKFAEVEAKGIKVISFLEAISNDFAYRIEKGERGVMTVKYVDTLPSMNIRATKDVEKFMQDSQKEIKIDSPIFVDVEVVNF